MAERLVHQKDVRAANECATERHALALTATQCLRVMMNLRRQTQDFADFHHAAANFRVARTACHEWHCDVMIDVKMRIQCIVLEHHRNVAVTRRDVVDSLPVDEQFART